MKLAIAGKGGSGKTSIAGTMARLMARSGRQVLAIDGDSNPNLSMTLGIPAAEMDGLPTLTRDMLRRTDGGVELTSSLEEICSTHSVVGPDGVRLLVMANPKHAGTGCLCSMHATVRTVIEAAANAPEEICLLDTEASPEHLSRGTARYAETMYCVVEPYFKSLETGRRMAALGRDLGLANVALVANKTRDREEEEIVRRFAAQHDLTVAGAIPFDERLPEAERAAAALLDFAPESPAVRAIDALAREALNGG